MPELDQMDSSFESGFAATNRRKNRESAAYFGGGDNSQINFSQGSQNFLAMSADQPLSATNRRT